jgi:hypothetical protein
MDGAGSHMAQVTYLHGFEVLKSLRITATVIAVKVK